VSREAASRDAVPRMARKPMAGVNCMTPVCREAVDSARMTAANMESTGVTTPDVKSARIELSRLSGRHESDDDRGRDSFSLHSLAKICARNFPILHTAPEGEAPMIGTRLWLLAAIALPAVMMLNCRAAVAEPSQSSSDYIMSGCRDAAAFVRFSDVAESQDDVWRSGFCVGVVTGLSFIGQPYGICAPAGTTSQQATRTVVQFIDAQPERVHEDFRSFVIEALRASWPCGIH